MKTLLFAATALATATAFAAPAGAAFFDYSGTRLLQQGGGANFSTIEVNLFIRTDGTQGVLHASNIVLFQIGLTRRDSANLITHSRFLKSNGSSPATLSIEGDALQTSGNALFFRFNSVGIVDFGISDSSNPFAGSRYCLTGRFEFGNRSCAFTMNTDPNTSQLDVVDFVGFGSADRFTFQGFGADTLALAPFVDPVPGGVPEPASWALMLSGFGLTGAAIRRRAAVRVTYA